MAWQRPKASSHSRGYGAAHQRARAAAARNHRPGDPCARCGHELGPMGPHLHYDHNGERTGYIGFSHAHCNVRAGAREGSRRAHGLHDRTPRPWHSRRW